MSRPRTDLTYYQFRWFICALICAEGETGKAKKTATTNLACTMLGPLFQAQGLSAQDAQRAADFAQAVHEMEDGPDPSVHGPHFDSIRDTLILLDDLAEAHPNSALPTLDDVEDFRKNFDWQLWDGKGGLEGQLHLSKDDRFILMVGTRYHRQRLFRTKENYLGLGPRSLQVGDELWILGATKFPFILRPLPTGAYRLVGIMHGEAVSPEVGFAEIELE